MAGSNLRHVTDISFDELISNSESPVLVDFWAPWCGHCRTVDPVIDALADEYAGKAVVAKMNIEMNPETPKKLGIQSIPTMIICKNGTEVERVIGPAGQKQLAELIDKAV